MLRGVRDFRQVLAIDAGLRNMGVCLMDSASWREPQVWVNEDLWPPQPGRRKKPTKQDVIDVTVGWLRQNQALFHGTDLVVLEQQIRVPFIIQNAVIQALWYDKVRVVSPMTIAAAFGLPKQREAKKARGIEFVQNCVWEDAFPEGDKQDDVADAWLLAAYGLVQSGGLGERDLFLRN